MGILMKMGNSRAVKKIAKTLPPFLVSGYGHAGPYSQGQVETAVTETGCDADYIDYAYAMFCDEATFNDISSAAYNAIHQEVADICFKGNSNFSTSDAVAYSSDSSGFDGGSGDGSGGGD